MKKMKIRTLFFTTLFLLNLMISSMPVFAEVADSAVSYEGDTMVINFLAAGAKSYDISFEEWANSESFGAEQYVNHGVLQEIGYKLEQRDKSVYPKAKLVIPAGNYYGNGAHAALDIYRSDPTNYPEMWNNTTIDIEEGAIFRGTGRSLWIEGDIKGLKINNFNGVGTFEISHNSQGLDVEFTGTTNVTGGTYIKTATGDMVNTLNGMAGDMNGAHALFAQEENTANIVFDDLVVNSGFLRFEYASGVTIKNYTALNQVSDPVQFDSWSVNVDIEKAYMPHFANAVVAPNEYISVNVIKLPTNAVSYEGDTMVVNYLNAGAKKFDISYAEWIASPEFESEKYYNFNILHTIAGILEERDKSVYPKAKVVIPAGNYYGDGAHAILDIYRSNASYPEMWNNTTIDFEDGAVVTGPRSLWIDGDIKGLKINNFNGVGTFEISYNSQGLDVQFTGKTQIAGGTYVKTATGDMINTLNSMAGDMNAAHALFAQEENTANIVFDDLVISGGFLRFEHASGVTVKNYTALNQVSDPIQFDGWSVNIDVENAYLPHFANAVVAPNEYISVNVIKLPGNAISYEGDTMVVNYLNAGAKTYNISYEEWTASPEFNAEQYENFYLLQKIGGIFEERDKSVYPKAKLVIPAGNYYGNGAHAILDIYRSNPSYPEMWNNTTIDFEEGAVVTGGRSLWIEGDIKGLVINNFNGVGTVEITGNTQNLDVHFTGTTKFTNAGIYIKPVSYELQNTLAAIDPENSVADYNSALESLASDANKTNIVFDKIVADKTFAEIRYVNGLTIKDFTSVNPIGNPFNIIWAANVEIGKVNIPKCNYRNMVLENVYNVHIADATFGTDGNDGSTVSPLIEINGISMSENKASNRAEIDNLINQNIVIDKMACYGMPKFKVFNGLSIGELTVDGAYVNGAEMTTFANLYIEDAEILGFNSVKDYENYIRGLWMERGSNAIIDNLDIHYMPESFSTGTRLIDCGGIGAEEYMVNNIMFKNVNLWINTNVLTDNLYGIQGGPFAPHNMRMHIIRHVVDEESGQTETYDDSMPYGWNPQTSLDITSFIILDENFEPVTGNNFAEKFNAALTIRNNKATNEKCLAIFAAYDSENRLISIDTKELDLVAEPSFAENSNTSENNIFEEVDFGEGNKPSRVKAFLWRTLSDMTPLGLSMER